MLLLPGAFQLQQCFPVTTVLSEVHLNITAPTFNYIAGPSEAGQLERLEPPHFSGNEHYN